MYSHLIGSRKLYKICNKTDCKVLLWKYGKHSSATPRKQQIKPNSNLLSALTLSYPYTYLLISRVVSLLC